VGTARSAEGISRVSVGDVDPHVPAVGVSCQRCVVAGVVAGRESRRWWPSRMGVKGGERCRTSPGPRNDGMGGSRPRAV
jgi:hypothetical protein